MKKRQNFTFYKYFAASAVFAFYLILPFKADALPATSSIEVLVNRSHPLQPITYTPEVLVAPKTVLATDSTDSEMWLRPQAAQALTTLFAAAAQDGNYLELSSGYRSFMDQIVLYNQLSTQDYNSKEIVAPPGTSEHQTGLAADIVMTSRFCAAQACFGMTRASQWLASHSYKYGFIERYPLRSENVTGYDYEPWHYRYVGKSLATRLFLSGEVLESYFGVKSP